jgi:4-hydroxybenzoate polyprenyltransferase
MSRLRAYLQLVRLPNIFTAIADIAAGYWLFSGTEHGSLTFAAIAGSSACLYAGGIVFNDICDIDVDRQERPNRPLPSGQITVGHARLMGIILMLAGIAIPLLLFIRNLAPLRTFVTALLLTVAILGYDFRAKSTAAGPLAMGLCRVLNLYLGMSLFWSPAMQWPAWALLSFFLYVTSFSYFGRDEARISAASRLKLGAAGIFAAIAVVGFFSAPRMSEDTFTLVLWLAFAVHIGRMTLRALRNPQPDSIMYAMKTFILCIILFDAVMVSSGQDWPPVLVVLSLLLPAVFAGRFLYST